MNQLPEFIQILVVYLVYVFITIVFAFLSRSRYLPVALRNPMLIVSIVIIKAADSWIPATENVKNWSAYLWGASVVVFLIMAFRNKWFWDDDKNVTK